MHHCGGRCQLGFVGARWVAMAAVKYGMGLVCALKDESGIVSPDSTAHDLRLAPVQPQALTAKHFKKPYTLYLIITTYVRDLGPPGVCAGILFCYKRTFS